MLLCVCATVSMLVQNMPFCWKDSGHGIHDCKEKAKKRLDSTPDYKSSAPDSKCWTPDLKSPDDAVSKGGLTVARQSEAP